MFLLSGILSAQNLYNPYFDRTNQLLSESSCLKTRDIETVINPNDIYNFLSQKNRFCEIKDAPHSIHTETYFEFSSPTD